MLALASQVSWGEFSPEMKNNSMCVIRINYMENNT